MRARSLALTALTLTIGIALWTSSVRADLANPAWFNPAWHYRVPITIPAAAAVNSTVVVNVNFSTLLTQLGINAGSVDFDELSPRVVRPNGATVATQEFNDRVFNNTLDAANNGSGEVRFLLQDAAAAGTYYLYFDITGNGVKPANPATPINGNFEQSAGNVPTSWVRSALNAGGAQNNEVYRTALTATTSVAAGCSTSTTTVANGPVNNGAVASGEAWALLGYRDNCEDGASGNETIRLARDIAVPGGAAAGNLTFNFQVQGWDGITNASNYDWFVFYVNGTPVTHTALGINNAPSPQLVIEASRLGRNGYSSGYRDHGWKLATLNLAAFAGTTINFRIEARFSSSDNSYRSWVKIDDVAWSIQNATLGSPQGFGANVQAPNDTAVTAASVLTVGQPVVLRVAVDATTTSVRADVYDDNSTLVAANRLLFDDGTHGDAVAGDRIFTNDGSVPADPTYVILATDPQGSAWRVRAFARDASVSSSGAANNGLVLRPGLPTAPVQANYFNIDEQVFSVVFTRLEVTKTSTTVLDPINVAAQPKAIPGAWVQYSLNVVNRGPGSADSNTVVIVDALPASATALCVTAACSGAATPVVFDDTGSAIPTGLTFVYATHVSYSTDGVTFNHVPAPDAAGFDAAITHVRIAPAGPMLPPTVAGDPSFVLRYVVRVD
ncbi:MAG: hypothetical protein HC809_00295 [Gammaproteobacteria bacterium]|nr:hypothetical protein [Gammaproteobacteria bacterium]